MDIKHYQYSQSIRNAKSRAKLGFFLLLLLLVLAILGYIPQNRDNAPERYLLITGLLLGLFGCVYILGWWADIEVDENGLLVEFLWMKLRVLWSDIVDVKPCGLKKFRYWVIITKNKLTIFHRLYGIHSLKSLNPSFLVDNRLGSHQFLITQILERIQK